MSTPASYSINLNARFAPLELVDVQALVEACADPWFNQTLCRVNDSVVRLGVVQGEFHWHKHDKEDEFFYVVEGRFVIDLEG
jgi:mannose-6-phosphate isomerase-like protein (cupin superfamily)